MSIFRKLSEDRIQKAMDEGQFEHLHGRGKPIKLEENPYEPEEWRASFRLLKHNNFTLPWIATWLDIEHDREVARLKLRNVYQQKATGQAWDRAREEFMLELARLNRRILEYNLIVPSAVFQKPQFDPEREIASALEG